MRKGQKTMQDRQPLPRPGQPDLVLVIALSILILLGLIMIYSASVVDALDAGVPFLYLRRQLLALGIGTAASIIVACIPYPFWRKDILPLMLLGSFVMLALLLFPNPLRGDPGPGGIAYRWLFNGSLRFQPSELVKFVVVVFAANFLDRRAAEMQHPFHPRELRHWLAYWGVIGTLALMIIKEPDLGTGVVVGAVGYFLLVAAGINWWVLSGLAAVGFGAFLGFAYTSAYRWQRILSWLDPWPEARGDAYQAIQGFVALANGGVWGRGLGQSLQKLGNLPEHHTDYIFAIFAEEFGLVGVLFLLLLYTLIVWRGFRIARLAPDRFGTLLASGLTALVVFQSFLNIAVISGLLPVTGVPLPFISYGGTSLMVNLAIMGVLVGISRYQREEERMP